MRNPISAGGSFFESLKALPANQFGLGSSMTVKVPAEAIRKAAAYVDLIELDVLVDRWVTQDREASRTGPGGRPPVFPVRAVLIAQLALSIAYGNASLKSLHELLTANLTPQIRRLMGFPVGAGQAGRALDQQRKTASYHAVTRRYAAIAKTFDPKPFDGGKAKTPEQVAKIEANRDPADVQLRQQRADQIQTLLLTGVAKELPTEYLSRWDGSLTIDGTKVPVWGRKGNGRKNKGARRWRDSDVLTLSPEYNAGWHAKDRDARDQSTPELAPKTEYTHAYELHMAVMTSEAEDVPGLILGASLDRPGRSPGQNAVQIVRGIRDAGFKPGTLTVDMGYSLKAPENYAYPMVAMGYSLMHMFQPAQLGVPLASYGGLSLIEGEVYGPCLPDVLRTASKDHHSGLIDDETLAARIEARRAYAARIKTAPDGAANYVWRCPGAGKGRTVRCDYKPVPATQRAAEVAANRHLPLIVDPPDLKDSPVCSHKESISVPAHLFVQWKTKYPYLTPEWRKAYAPARNEMEGKNGYLKQGRFQLADPNQRRMRGYAKQFLAVLAKLVAANIRTLCTFIWDQIVNRPQAPNDRPGRKKKAALLATYADPNAPPARTIGIDLPKREVA